MRVLVTGGAGFLGSNLAYRLHRDHTVTVLDDLSRPGSIINSNWLQSHGVRCVVEDVGRVRGVFGLQHFDVIYHLAGQTTVTESVKDPLEDFDQNALRTVLVLDWMRKYQPHAKLIYASTNKVYGRNVSVKPTPETTPVEFCSPYGCSKGAAEQYVTDYAKTYGLQTVSFRQSCIYGERQWGMEGQGWVSWFAQRLYQRKPITIYGDGEQVRDILYVSDWVRAAVRAMVQEWSGEVINIGGGPDNSIALITAISMLEDILGVEAELGFEPPRTSDQQVYVSDITRAYHLLNWKPLVAAKEGLKALAEWTKISISTERESGEASTTPGS